MALTMPSLPMDPKRLRSYLMRMPLVTRLLLGACIVFFVLGRAAPGFSQWATLTPNDLNLLSMHKINTYPLLHPGAINFILNIAAIVPLLDRFEAVNGSIITFVLFTGPFATIPGLLYVFVERFLLHNNTAVAGASIWIFLLVAAEAVKASKVHPHFQVGPVQIPTWSTPLIANVFVSALIPRTSFICHLCGIAVGSLWGLGYIRFLAPSERILRWIEGKLNLLARVPHYVSVDQKTYGRYGILPSVAPATPIRSSSIPMGGGQPGLMASAVRLGSN